MLYAIFAIGMMVLSIILAQSLPMVLGCIALFIMSGKLAFWVSELLFGESHGELVTLIRFGIMALCGIGLMMIAIKYTSSKRDIDAAVQSYFGRGRVSLVGGGGSLRVSMRGE